MRPRDLPDAPLFRYGERLFEAGYFWEAHAVWEELWLGARRAACASEAEADLLRAFIQLAAAALKEALGNKQGQARLLARAEAAIARAAAGAALPAELRARFARLRAGLPSGDAPRRAP